MSNDYFVHAENDYRREALTRSAAASRSGRTRSSWLRRLAASDPTLRRSTR